MFEAAADGSISIKNLNESRHTPPKIKIPLGQPNLAGENVLQLLAVATEVGERAAESIRAAAMGKQMRDLPRCSPDKSDPEAIQKTALLSLQQAELYRYQCQSKWRELCITSQRMAIHLQVIVTKLQSSQELFLQVVSDLLKKIAVFESSTIANLQYDIQMLFKVVESINPDDDISHWIDRNITPSPLSGFFHQRGMYCEFLSCWDIVAPNLSKMVDVNVAYTEINEAVIDPSFFDNLDPMPDYKGLLLRAVMSPVAAVSSLHPPTNRILSSDVLHDSLKEHHYIIAEGNIRPPCLKMLEICENLLAPRLVKPMKCSLLSKHKEPVLDFEIEPLERSSPPLKFIDNANSLESDTFSRSDDVVHALIVLSKLMLGKWSHELDPYEYMMRWLRDMNDSSSGSNLNLSPSPSTTSLTTSEVRNISDTSLHENAVSNDTDALDLLSSINATGENTGSIDAFDTPRKEDSIHFIAQGTKNNMGRSASDRLRNYQCDDYDDAY